MKHTKLVNKLVSVIIRQKFVVLVENGGEAYSVT